MVAGDCVAILSETRNGSVRIRESKIGDTLCLRQARAVLRPLQLRTAPGAAPALQLPQMSWTPIRLALWIASGLPAGRRRQSSSALRLRGGRRTPRRLGPTTSCTPSWLPRNDTHEIIRSYRVTELRLHRFKIGFFLFVAHRSLDTVIAFLYEPF